MKQIVRPKHSTQTKNVLRRNATPTLNCAGSVDARYTGTVHSSLGAPAHVACSSRAPAAPGLTSRPRAPSCSLGGAGPGPLAAVRLARWTLVATVAPRRTAGISIPVAYPGCDFPLRRWSRAERVNGAAVGQVA